MKIHHIGYAVKNISESIYFFELLGFKKEKDIIEDYSRNVKILFLKNQEYRIELIEPLEENSPVDKILNKNGNIPYHICYETNNLDKDISVLTDKGFILIDTPKKAEAISNKNVCFLYNKNIGLLELLETQSCEKQGNWI